MNNANQTPAEVTLANVGKNHRIILINTSRPGLAFSIATTEAASPNFVTVANKKFRRADGREAGAEFSHYSVEMYDAAKHDPIFEAQTAERARRAVIAAARKDESGRLASSI